MRSIFTFVVEDADGSQREVEFELRPDIAERVWHVVSRGRREAGPESPPGE
jgi:hypothetical protein